MTLWQLIILAIVQGITEFLPISSTAHLRVIPALLQWEDPGAAITAILQLGSLLALLLYYRRDCVQMIRGVGPALRAPNATPNSRILWGVVLGTIPIGLCGYLGRHWIKSEFRSLWVISATLIVVGVLLWIVEKRARFERSYEQITIRDGIVIGIAQCFALIPGVSRSGISMVGGMGSGLRRDVSARFSFLLGIPALLAAGVFEIWEIRHELTGDKINLLLLGIFVTALVSYLTIDFLIRFLKNHSTGVFVVYRVILGVLLAFLLWRGTLIP